MKRTLIVLVSILIGTFVVFTLLDFKGEYAAEKAIYKINKKFGKIKDDPLAVPEARYKEVVEDYKKFLKRFPDSKLAPFAHILIGRTYALKKDYDTARSTFERVVQQYDAKPAIAAQGLLEIVSTYSQQNDIPSMTKTYERLKRDYPLTEQGMAAPFTLARIIAAGKDPAAKEAFNNAVKYYRQLILKHGKSEVSFRSLNYIATCQLSQQQWRQAVNAYEEMLMTYAEPPYMNDRTALYLLKAINTFSIVQAKDFQLPVDIYNRFMSKFPDHPLNPVLKKMITGIEQLKLQQETQAQQQTKSQEAVPAAP